MAVEMKVPSAAPTRRDGMDRFGLAVLILSILALSVDLALGVISVHRALVNSISVRHEVGEIIVVVVICLVGPATILLWLLDVFHTGLPLIRRAAIAGCTTIGVAFIVSCLMVQFALL